MIAQLTTFAEVLSEGLCGDSWSVRGKVGALTADVQAIEANFEKVSGHCWSGVSSGRGNDSELSRRAVGNVLLAHWRKSRCEEELDEEEKS